MAPRGCRGALAVADEGIRRGGNKKNEKMRVKAQPGLEVCANGMLVVLPTKIEDMAEDLGRGDCWWA